MADLMAARTVDTKALRKAARKDDSTAGPMDCTRADLKAGPMAAPKALRKAARKDGSTADPKAR